MKALFSAAARGLAVAGALLVALTGCTGTSSPTGSSSPSGSASPTAASPTTASPTTSAAGPTKVVTGDPGPGPGQTTLVVVGARTGDYQVGTFTATPGDLWVVGDCVGGTVEIHVDPVVVFPIPCSSLGQGLFGNLVQLNNQTTITVWVVADEQTTWNLRLEQ